MIVLASQSPRRQELLKAILGDIPFLSLPSTIDERSIREEDCSLLVLEEALLKAQDVATKRPEDLVIASDTMVVFEGKQLGKPKDEEDAKKTLERLQGKEHQILTGYAIQKGKDVLRKGVVSSRLYIDKMSREEIERYVATKSPLDKAGSYGIQDEAYIHSEIREGYKENIMGFPTHEIRKALVELGTLK